MDVNQDMCQNIQPFNDLETNKKSNLKTISLFTLFFVQFLLSQLIQSYGIYTIYFTQHNVPIIDALWPPVLFLATTKISSPCLQIISESFYEQNGRFLYFFGIIICHLGVALCYFFTDDLFICGIFYGVIGGIGSCLVTSLLNYHLYDIFPYQSHLVLGIHYLGIAFGLFVTPIILKTLFDYLSINFVFLTHGSILLTLLPTGLLIKKQKISQKQRLKTYSNSRTNEIYEEEMLEMSQNKYSLVSRNWKSPSDIIKQEEYVDIDENDNTKKISSAFVHKTNSGVNILPQIVEEDEYETDDELKRNSVIFNNNLKRMSVISVKLEEIIQKEEELTVLDVKSLAENKHEVTNDEIMNISLSVDQNLNSQNKRSCCTPYQKYRFRKKISLMFTFIYKLLFKPIINSIQIIEFYPSLLTNIHSLLSPLIFLNFVVYRAYSLMTVKNSTELSFMFSVIGFAYLVFLITLPWITQISKRNLKYVYIFGCSVSTFGVYMSSKTKNDDHMIVSCLVYGLGFGIESYLKEIVLKEFLGVSKWSRCENTLECLSGILLLVLIIILRNTCGVENKFDSFYYSERWLNVIFCSHLIIGLVWIAFPVINYLFDSLFYRNQGKYSFR